MLKNSFSEPSASPSSSPLSNSMANSVSSNFMEENEGLAVDSGNPTMPTDPLVSVTDITLDQALIKMKEIDKENLLLKEYLAENNNQIKRQYEALMTLKQKDKEKFDQAKALVTSLNEEIKELQIRLMAQEDKEKENEKLLVTFKNENANLLRQKALSDQRTFHILKQAEKEGLEGLDDTDNLPQVSETVFVSTEDKEREIETLEASIVEKEEIIRSLRDDRITACQQRDQYKNSNEILLRDMETMQQQKEQLDEERRQLHDQNIHLSKELDLLMKSNIAFTKKEIEVQKHVTSSKHNETSADDSLLDLDNGENLLDMLKQQQLQEEIDQLKFDLDNERTDRKEMEDKFMQITNETKELQSQYELMQQRCEQLEQEKIKLSKDYEDGLTGITLRNEETSAIKEAKISEDKSVLRSQVVSLLHEVAEINQKHSAALLALQQKERRIEELSSANVNWKDRYEEHSQQSGTMEHMLKTQLSQMDTVKKRETEEHRQTKQQYQELQDNFNRLVTDYKVLLEMFEMEKARLQANHMSKQTMEEMDKMAAQVMAAEEAIDYRDRQLKELKNKLGAMDEKNKLLLIQLDTYQSDFQTERQSRSKLAQEKSELEDELKKVREQAKAANDQFNQKQIEDMQRRVNPRHSFIPDSQLNYDLQQNNGRGHGQSPSPQPPHQPVSAMQLQESFFQTYNMGKHQEANAGMQQSYNTMGPRGGHGGHGALDNFHMQMPGPVQPEDPGEDQLISLAHECPGCGANLPDADTLQLHASDCLDRLNLN